MWLVLCLTVWNTVRLGASIADWELLAEFAPRPGPLYITASASLWTLGGLAVWIAIRRRHPRAQSFIAIYFIGYAMWWWADRLLLQQAQPNWPFAIALTIILLALAAFDVVNRKATAYFHQRETHEQTTTDSNPA